MQRQNLKNVAMNNNDVAKVVGLNFALEGFLTSVKFSDNNNYHFSGKRPSDGKIITFNVLVSSLVNGWVAIEKINSNIKADYTVFVIPDITDRDNTFVLDNMMIHCPFIGFDELATHKSLKTKFLITFESVKENV